MLLSDCLCRFPGRGIKADGFRVPSVICYRRNGTVCACGEEAEALEEEVENDFVDLGDDTPPPEDLIFLRW